MLHRHAPPPDENRVPELAPEAPDGSEYTVASGAPRGWWLPIVVSATVFALVHLDFRAPRLDFIPLFFFACGLGYLYQRTHRALPSILLHMTLNICSLALLFAGGAAH